MTVRIPRLRYQVALKAIGVTEVVATAADVTVASAMAASYRQAIAADPQAVFTPARIEVVITDTKTGETL